MQVLSVASEAVPHIKTGGLADVAGALPAALAPLGGQMRLLLPAYRALRGLCAGEVLWQGALMGAEAKVYAAGAVLLLDAPHLYDRAGGPYHDEHGADFADNDARFAGLCQAAVAIAAQGLADGWRPDLLHAHDWQGALVPVYARLAGLGQPTVLTVHNIAFQGVTPRDRLGALGLPEALYHEGTLEYWGQLNVLKAGMICADRVTTVSPNYAAELRRPEFGQGLDGVINALPAPIVGILNGIDQAVWSPLADPEITPYGPQDMAGKAANRLALLKEFGLSDAGGPLAIVVSRLTGQKGLDLLPEALPAFCARGGMVAILGTGEPWLEARLAEAAQANPAQIGFQRGYDEGKSHRMFAGADAVLVPSRFEPCGLTQLYGLAYGAVPVVAATGGLWDSVIAATPAALANGVATGVVMARADALGLHLGLGALLDLWAQPLLFAQLRAAGMAADFGWGASALAYLALYKSLMQNIKIAPQAAEKPKKKPKA